MIDDPKDPTDHEYTGESGPGNYENIDPINPPTEGDKEAAKDGSPPMTPEEEQIANSGS
jgi:hypothetical protein